MKNTSTVTTKITLEIDVEIEGRFYNGWWGDRENPPEPPDFEIDKIKFIGTSLTKGTNITNLVNPDDFADISENCISILIDKNNNPVDYDDDSQ